MPTRREYLISLNLAVPGRGKFSREGNAALDKARADGMAFDDDGLAPKANRRPRDAEPLVVKEYVPAPSHPPLPPQPKVRDIGKKELVGFTPEGWQVGFVTCNRCFYHANFCQCPGGPVAPEIVTTLDKNSIAQVG